MRQVQSYPEIGTAFNALQAGQVDGVINDFAVSAFALKKYPQLDVVQTIPTGEQYGFPMQKPNTALIDAVNGALKRRDRRRHLPEDLREVVHEPAAEGVPAFELTRDSR